MSPHVAPLRVMVWGAGFFGRKWAETVAARADCRLTGLVSRSADRVEALRRDLGLPGLPAYGSVDDALGRGAADAVVVTLPQMFHRDAIVKALGAGLHVLTEKPLAMSLDEAGAILAAARARPDRVAMVNQNFRWRPHTRALRDAVREGLIGRPGHVMMECRQPIRRTTVDGWRERMPDPYLMDFAIHHFDLMRYLTGEEPVEALAASFRPAWSWLDGHTAAAATITMTGGLVVSYGGTMVSTGFDTPQEGLVTIMGDRGALHLDGRSEVRLVGQGEPRVVPPAPVPEGELGHALALFLTAVATGQPPETDLADNVRSFALLLSVVESARTGRSVRVDERVASLLGVRPGDRAP